MATRLLEGADAMVNGTLEYKCDARYYTSMLEVPPRWLWSQFDPKAAVDEDSLVERGAAMLCFRSKRMFRKGRNSGEGEPVKKVRAGRIQ
jgi:hypothetical protein